MTMRILIVDDEPLARSRLRDLLSDCPLPAGMAGLSVGEASHAVQAMEQLQHRPWDVVLLDIHMPGMDGLSLARHLQALPEPPAVVFVTAHAEHALEAFELAAVDYLTKPVRLQRLQQALEKHGAGGGNRPQPRFRTPISCSSTTGAAPNGCLWTTWCT